jgi:hypothetical protein
MMTEPKRRNPYTLPLVAWFFITLLGTLPAGAYTLKSHDPRLLIGVLAASAVIGIALLIAVALMSAFGKPRERMREWKGVPIPEEARKRRTPLMRR